MQDKIDALKKSASAKQSRIKELDGLLRMVDYYKSGKPAADKLKSIRFEKSRQKYKAEHDDELRTFYMAERKLKPYFQGRQAAHHRMAQRARAVGAGIQGHSDGAFAAPCRREKALGDSAHDIYEVQHEQERQNTATAAEKAGDRTLRRALPIEYL